MALLGSLKGALGGEEVAGGVVGLVIGAAHLGRRSSRQRLSACLSAAVACVTLTCSNSASAGGQLVGSWHTHMGVLLSSSSHTFPFLQ